MIGPTIDYRKASETYILGLKNFDELIKTLEKCKATEFGILRNETFISSQHLQVFEETCDQLISHYKE